MSNCSIDAEYKGEERYSKLTIAYGSDEEKQHVEDTVQSTIVKYDIKPELYTSDINSNRQALVVEYHDDYDREAGTIFEEILKILDIKCS